MIVICYLYNTNGMASWCLEAALALHLQGEQVILIRSKNTILPGNFPVLSLEFDETVGSFSTFKYSLLMRALNKANRYICLLPFVKIKTTFLLTLHRHLKACSINPKTYLLNQSNLVNRKVPVAQHMVAWAYKPYLYNYIKKSFLLATGFKSFQNNLYNAFYWHKADWSGYKYATGIMAVSNKLCIALKKSGIDAHTIYPGVNLNANEEIDKNCTTKKIVNLAVMALSIDDKRKGFKNIIIALKKIKPYNFKLTLIGDYSTEFKTWVENDGFPATFKGRLNRTSAIAALTECDVLLFGSLVDDWGYVQIEAMSKGLAVFAPNASPFDEIVGRNDYLYDQSSPYSMENKLSEIIINKEKLNMDKIWFKKRYTDLFSSNTFGKAIISLVSKK